MKTSFALIVAATSVFVFTQAADAQCDCQQTVSYYAPVADHCLLRSDHCLLRSDHCLLRSDHCLLLQPSAYYAPTTAYYGGSGYYGSGYYGGYYRGGLFGTGLGGWAGVRGIDRRWDRRGW